MKILVIGGNRFFGKTLVSKLVDHKHDVTVLNRGNISDGFLDTVKRINVDRSNQAAFTVATQDNDWDIVYDQVCFDAKDAKAACEIFKNKTKLYVFTSTQSVYGWGSDLKETDFDPITYTFKIFVSQKENYGEAKRQAEATFSKYATFPVQIVRFPIVIGTDDYTGRFKFHVDSVREQMPIYFTNTKATISMISSEDAARFLFQLLEIKNSEIVNCASSFKLVLRDFIEEIGTQNNQKIRYAADSKSGTISPYVVEQDWIMSIQKLNSQYGFVTKDNKEFISELISYFSNK